MGRQWDGEPNRADKRMEVECLENNLCNDDITGYCIILPLRG